MVFIFTGDIIPTIKSFSFKMYMSMVFSIFTQLCTHHHDIIPEHFHHPTKKPSTH